MFNFFKKKAQEPQELFFHTDMHCHLVPGIDDGQRNAEGGADLVAHEHSWGIRKIITTPHVTQDTFENTPDTINAAFDKLQQAVAEKGIDIAASFGGIPYGQFLQCAAGAGAGDSYAQ